MGIVGTWEIQEDRLNRLLDGLESIGAPYGRNHINLVLDYLKEEGFPVNLWWREWRVFLFDFVSVLFCLNKRVRSGLLRYIAYQELGLEGEALEKKMSEVKSNEEVFRDLERRYGRYGCRFT